MINYGQHYLDKKDFLGVLEVLSSKNLTQGKFVEIFEKNLVNYFGSKYACSISNATSGLYLLSEIFNWNKNDDIFLSPLTFLAGANSVARSNAKPNFIDINKDNYNLDLNILEHQIKKKKYSAKAIIATDFAGLPCDWKSLRFIANKYQCRLINDNCHALGSSYYNSRKYAAKYADCVVQSYHAVKNFTTGEGGSVLTNNKKIYEKLKSLRSHGIFKNTYSRKSKPWWYDMSSIGYNFRLTDIQASLGISQIKKLNIFVKRRREIAKIYDTFFNYYNDIQIPWSNKNFKSSYHLYTLQINFKKFKKKRENLFNFFWKRNINLQVHYIPTYKFKFYKKKYNINEKNFPNTEKFYENEISLPIFYKLENSMVQKISESLIKFLKK